MVGLCLVGTAAAVPGAFDHPLMHAMSNPAVVAELAAVGGDHEQLLWRLDVYSEVYDDGVGPLVTTSGADVPVTTPISGTTHTPSLSLHVDDQVAAWLAEPWLAPATMDVWLRVDRGMWRTGDAFYDAEIGMLDGTVTTDADFEAEVAARVAQWESDADAVLAPLVNDINTSGGTVTEIGRLSGAVRATVDITLLTGMTAWTDVRVISAHEDMVPNSAGWSRTVTPTLVDGWEAADLLQSIQYYNLGITGDNWSDYVALRDGRVTSHLNSGGIRTDHWGLLDLGGAARHVNVTDTNAGSTASVVNSDFSPNLWLSAGNQHATSATAALAGSIMDGQDSSITCGGTPDPCERKSGVARTARVRGFPANGNFSRFVDYIATEPRAMLLSQSWGSPSTDCAGTSASSGLVNSIYESGLAAIVSAGNEGRSATAACDVTAPGAGIGAFTVGAYEVDSSSPYFTMPVSSGEGDDPKAPLSSTSSRGRSIVDIIAPTLLEWPYVMESGLSTSGGVPCSEYSYFRQSGSTTWCTSSWAGTSASTPLVAGSAALFREQFRSTLGDLILHPGVLYANLLHMGDRATTSSYTAYPPHWHLGYDSWSGAGRLRLRMWNKAGLDAPAYVRTGYTCVPHHTAVTIPVHGSKLLSTDVDYIKVTTYLYDFTHDLSEDTAVNSHDILLYEDDGSGWSLVAADTVGQDNKRRIFYEPTEPARYKVEIRGINVFEENAGCGSSSTRVHYALSYEDNDRDDTSPAIPPDVRHEN